MTTWVKSLPSGDPWSIEGDNKQRITEEGRVRVIEQAPTVRIIERFTVTWASAPPPYNPWVTT